jgi:hypothetical protein
MFMWFASTNCSRALRLIQISGSVIRLRRKPAWCDISCRVTTSFATTKSFALIQTLNGPRARAA